MGTELLTTGSIVAAFFAGGVALFAPCCIVFLAPSYLAGAAKSHRWRLLPLTLTFALGLSVILVPITLGMSLLAGAIAKYHAPLYWAGGILMFALAALALSGKMWSLPSFIRSPDTTRGDTGSFFALGVFSGIASSCCAPVLAGVMTLSALSGSAAGGLLLGFAYVFGMVFPLFIMALAWDRARLGERRLFRAKSVTVRVAGRAIMTNTINIAVAIAFVAMGAFVIALANSTDMTGGSRIQDWMSERLTATFARILGWLEPIPEVIQGLLLLMLVALLIRFALRDRRRRPEPMPADAPAPADDHVNVPSCH